MRLGFILSTVCASLITFSPANAYEGLEKDFQSCTQGSGKIPNTQIVQACTRLIDNAAKHNSLTGSFFALRAIANTDKASNCQDARQALKLLENPNLIKHAKTLEKINCK